MNGNLDLPVADIHQVAGVAFEITDCQATLGLVNGSYLFFHYLVDGFDDRGWGCAYRSLQTLASWCVFGQYSNNESLEASRKVHDLVPSMKELVHLTGHMFGNLADESTRWIGSMEVVAALDVLYGVSCTVLTFTCQRSRYEDDFRAATSRLSEHFSETGLRSPVMFGGHSGRALTILGISVRKSTASQKDLNDSNGMKTVLEGSIRLPHVQLLILDPHYINSDQKQGARDRSQYARDGGIGWFDAHKVFRPDEFFNLCIPRSKVDSGIRLFNSVTVAERIEQAIADYARVEKQSDADWGIELVAGD